ncbi:MAG: hypothetical protein Q9M08_06775, partial [Mariprofundus sp.]|nr:hypothetical protein [Mariprofundus sp.]
MIKKGTVVSILPEWQDPGDNDLIWVTVNDEEKGRVDIAALNAPNKYAFGRFHIHPVKTEWIRP